MADGALPAELDVATLGRTMLEAARMAHIGVTLTVIDEGGVRNVYANEVAARIVGRTVADVLARDPLADIAEEDLPQIRERLARRTRGETGEISYRITVKHKDGSRVPIEVTASRTTYDGRPAVVAFMVEASARRLAEQEKLRIEVSFRQLIESAPEPIGIIRDNHFVYTNQTFVSVLGYPSAESLYAVPLGKLVHPDEAQLRADRERFIVQERGRPPPQTYRARKHDGSTVVLEVTSVPFEYEGKPSGLTIARDVTEHKALEAQLVQADRLAALGTMAAGVAHEINNPLGYVTLNLDWIARKLPLVEQDPSSLKALIELLREARAGVDRVASIVRELRAFSRADGETRHNVQLTSVVESAIRIAAHEIRHRATVKTSFKEVRPVWANEARLEQVVLNLLLNAAQAMGDRPAERNQIRVSIRPEADRLAALEISDNGEGIAPEILPKIFDPFFTTKGHGAGTGLGLSICHGIVTSLGGRITVRSEPGEGTTFRIVLPTSDSDGPSAAKTSDAPPPSSARKARVLVVDDELPIANTMKDLLSAEHDVVAVTSGQEAMEILRSGRPFDVVLCDLMMPSLSGMDIFERLRVESPGVEQRVVFMTGGAFTTRAAEFLAAVENRRIEKPFSLRSVERIIAEMTHGPERGAVAQSVVLLNIDLGETPDEPDGLFALAHIANIACGGHAGDDSSMGRALDLCRTHGTRVGAHPSYPDRAGFGRRPISMSPEALRETIAEQCGRLAAHARTRGQRIEFVKPHGALYHASRADSSAAKAILEGARDALGHGHTLIGPPDGALAMAAAQAQVAYAREGFADRAKRDDGSLVPREETGALVTEPEAAVALARDILRRAAIDTLCVHADTPGALVIARAVRELLDATSSASQNSRTE